MGHRLVCRLEDHNAASPMAGPKPPFHLGGTTGGHGCRTTGHQSLRVVAHTKSTLKACCPVHAALCILKAH